MSDDPQKRQVLDEANVLMKELCSFTFDASTPHVMLAAELLIAYRAVKDRMPLQELMDNLLRNMPAMYAVVLEAEEPSDLVTLDEKFKA